MAEISYLKIEDSFYSGADKMRRAFEKRFAAPLVTTNDRFVWDYWYVPNQYNLIRTPAESFFPDKVWDDFQKYLVRWGQVNLGCHAISQPWLSYYVEGCEQHLHADIPHGPWAYVFSLTPKRRRFRGGETVILEPQVLRYWSDFNIDQGLEREHLTKTIAPDYNRLVVFDPRLPHGVSRVDSVRDPLEARLVIHGWFAQPRPFVEGGLSVAKIAPTLADLVGEISEWINAEITHLGTLTFRFKLSPAGKVLKLELLTNTLVSHESGWVSGRLLTKGLSHLLAQFDFPKAVKASSVTVPMVFG